MAFLTRSAALEALAVARGFAGPGFASAGPRKRVLSDVIAVLAAWEFMLGCFK